MRKTLLLLFLIVTTSVYAQEIIVGKLSRLIVISCKDTNDILLLSKPHDTLNLIAKDNTIAVFRVNSFVYDPDGLFIEDPFPLGVIRGTDTMIVEGISSNFHNYHLKNFEFKKGNWFIKTKPWFQQKVVTGKEIMHPDVEICKEHRRSPLHAHISQEPEYETESFEEMFFFEIDLANKDEVEMILMDEKERRKFDRHPRSDNIMDWKNYLILDDKALQYIKMIKKDGHVPYIAPCYTKEEYEESISPCRKQK